MVSSKTNLRKGKKMKAGFYKADTVNGVYYQDLYLDEPATDVLTQKEFKESLSTLEDGEEICAFFDAATFDILDEIEKEYGINA